MRNVLRRLPVVLVALAMFPPAVSLAAQHVTLSVAFRPDHPGARTTISLGFHITGPHGAPPAALTNLVLRMPENMGLATTTLGQANCYPRPLLQFVFPGVLEEDVRPFGDRLDTTIPLLEPWPEGPYIALTSFRSTIGPLHLTYHRQVNGKRIAYKPHGLLIPKDCSRGGYPFAAILTFQDGTTTHAVTHVACSNQAGKHGKH